MKWIVDFLLSFADVFILMGFSGIFSRVLRDVTHIIGFLKTFPRTKKQHSL